MPDYRCQSGLQLGSAATLAILFLLGGCMAESADRPAALPARAGSQYLEVFTQGRFQPLFIKGVNLGIGVPGTQPGELAADYDDYRTWLDQIAAFGFNTVRVYTLHFPHFYRALADHNTSAIQPIYLLHGIWLDEELPDGGLAAAGDVFDESIREVVDAVHGNKSIGQRFGRAYGDYTAGVSNWIIGWVIGREVHPVEVDQINKSDLTGTFRGAQFQITNADPFAAWITSRFDGLVGYERETYGVDRPVSFSSWPTLDPLVHPTEVESSGEDIATMDLLNIKSANAPAGWFASYHAYPYYPDFMNDDPNYAMFDDDLGLNNYIGYLTQLKSYYIGIPLVIAEFGVPSSWGNAHFSISGMHHGGHTEREQMAFGSRMIGNISQSGLAGAVFFAWLDEWWKRTWITDPLTFPRDRYRLWHDLTSPEQNFGIIGFRAAPFATADLVPVNGPAESTATIQALASGLNIWTRVPLDEITYIGLDTYDDSLGQQRYPNSRMSNLAMEFCIDVSDNTAQLRVIDTYDRFGMWHGTPATSSTGQSTDNQQAEWVEVRWLTNPQRTLATGATVPAEIDPIGKLIVRRQNDTPTSHDAVAAEGSGTRIHLPWTLLNIVDPSASQVLHDDPETIQPESLTTRGVRVEIVTTGGLVSYGRFGWDGWDNVGVVESYYKNGSDQLANILMSLPDTPASQFQ